jgi:hypothetical protein
MKLTDFEGCWQLERRITNAVGPDATFTGTAEFAPQGAALILRESGHMRIDGQAPMQATRVYRWQVATDGIDVFFDDGRFFHHIAPGQTPQAHHDCAPDVYDVAYDFSRWPQWSAVWQVKGPRKDYRMETQYHLV